MINNVLNLPFFYRTYSTIVGSNRFRTILSKDYICAKKHDKILDIGCGTGDILQFLPEVTYYGFDMNRDYIKTAKKVYNNKGFFFCKKVTKNAFNKNLLFDIVLAIGILHHLNDENAMNLLFLAKKVLKPSGKLITADGCYLKKQSLITRFLLSQDRGRYIRSVENYKNLSNKFFPKISTDIREDLLYIPSTVLIMKCFLN